MIRALGRFRLSRLQLVAVASASLTATVLIVVNATGSTGLDRAVVAALARGVVIHRTPAVAQSAPVTGSASGGTGTAHSARNMGGGSSAAKLQAGGGGNAGSTAAAPITTTTPTGTTTSITPHPPAPKLKHVFVIALTTSSYAAAFGKHSAARYLNRTLRPRGTLLSGYRTLASGSELADELATVSGQAPNSDTRAGCQTYAEFPPTAKAAADGQVPGAGCVYPDTALTIGDQITSAGLRWGAYIQDMGQRPCVHPNSNAVDNGPLEGAGPEYDTRHNPFIYFHSLLDLGDCASDDVSLDRLGGALRKASDAPAFAYVAPGSCDDAAATGCPAGALAGLAAEDAFLKLWVPRIEASPAYRDGGALLIAFAAPGSARAQRAGALLLSREVAGGRTVTTAYDPYALLRTIESLLGLAPLAHAKTARSFADLLTKRS